jgi:hypothetical protein
MSEVNNLERLWELQVPKLVNKPCDDNSQGGDEPVIERLGERNVFDARLVTRLHFGTIEEGSKEGSCWLVLAAEKMIRGHSGLKSRESG